MKTIELTDEKYEEIKAQLGEDFKDINSYEDLIGEKMFFRTVTYHALGEVKKIVGRFVYLKKASWVADTGRFRDFIRDEYEVVEAKTSDGTEYITLRDKKELLKVNEN